MQECNYSPSGEKRDFKNRDRGFWTCWGLTSESLYLVRVTPRKVWFEGKNATEPKDKRDMARWLQTHEFMFGELRGIEGVRWDAPLPTASAPHCFCSVFPFRRQDHTGIRPEKKKKKRKKITAASDNASVSVWHLATSWKGDTFNTQQNWMTTQENMGGELTPSI